MSSEKPKRRATKKKTPKVSEPEPEKIRDSLEPTKHSEGSEPKIADFNDLVKKQTQVLAKLQDYMDRLEAMQIKVQKN